ncbi:30S ribosomal protein S1 [Marinoscillum sp. 108]|uniref:30S ribosomal protein S1 n=1 Tax=Marinoscillum sp. 108 TaxID=2653151 RepID=UPI0012F31880|nr:30S ribosomal protein S1 [Marinoscillum sp. 108]VXD13306.1 Small subunit ribosomal protein S1 [Marinoscillum sp. 108]
MAEDKKDELQDVENTEAQAAETPEETKAVEAAEETPAEEAKKEVAEEVKAEPAKEEVKAPVAKEVKAPEVQAPIAEAEVDIWDTAVDDGFGEEYSDKDRKKMEALYEATLNQITEKEVMAGTVVGITDRDVIINIGFKSDGLVALSEFRDVEDLKPGDAVEVYVEEQENANGQLVLSRRKAKIVKAWENIQKGLDEDMVINGMVKRRTKGGLIVDIFGVEAFLPGSQIDVKPIRDFDVFVGKKMEVKVVKINYANDNVVVSHKVLIEKDIEKQKAVILENLEKGQVLEGVIKNMTNFGVFIDLGGVDGLLHITDISWGRINHPEEVLSLDAKVNVVVLDFDDDKKRISLGMKQLTAHPWDSLDKDMTVGSKVKGKIVNVADYGAFLEIIPGVEGLIHVSEMSWSQHLRNPQDFISVGDQLEAVVLTIDRDDRKMSLGIKQLTEDPWTKQDVLTNYAVGTKHTGIVRNLTNFGLFIELEEGIDGLVHVSDLSWTKKIKHPSEFVKVGDELEVVVMELDVDNRRLALSHKHLEENPWDTFETVFTRGSVHKCTVISKNDRGGLLELPYGLEGQVTTKNLQKEDGSQANEGETLDFKVMEFSKDEKRIVLSHTSTWKEGAEQPAPAAAPAPKKGKSSKGNTLNKINQETEKSTLGDLEALSALKDKMESAAKPAAAKPAKKAAPKAEEKAPEAEGSEEESKDSE